MMGWVACISGLLGVEQSPTSDPPSGRGAVEDKEKVVRTIEEWRRLLTPSQFRVLRLKATEPPFRNKYDRQFEPGVYACAGCDQELFSSETKFDSGCGWPAFYAAKAGDRVILTPDYSHGTVRTEVLCARCESHLGHLFPDAPQTPTGERFCINSTALKFIPAQPEEPPAPKKR
jgi:peptide-methionine (R)-S-oxide reductase